MRLGLDEHITRRDFVGTTLIGAGTALLGGCSPKEVEQKARVEPDDHPWTGYGGVGDYRTANGNTQAVIDAAHLIRDKQHGPLAATADETGEVFDVVIVGGGFAGLGAAFQFHEKSEGKTCLIIDNHPVFGGEARENEFEVDGHRLFGPQGSNGFMPPVGSTTLSDDVWRAVGMPMEYTFADQDSDFGLRVAHDSYDGMYWGERNLDLGHYFRENDGGRWERNIWDDDLARTPWPEDLRADLRRAYLGNETAKESQGLSPERLGPWLDGMSYASYLSDAMGFDERVTSFLDPILAISDYGCSCDVISAYAAYLLQMPGMKGYFTADTFDFSQIKIMSFPGGNTTYARCIARHLIPSAIRGDGFEPVVAGRLDFGALDRPDQPTRMRLETTVIDLHHDGDEVLVTYVRHGQARAVRARSVVMATGGWVARNVVSDMPEPIREAYSQFHHAPVLVVNVALRNWRFLDKLGFAAARWYDGFGFFGGIRAPMKIGEQTPPYHPDLPMVMTFYVPFQQAGRDIGTQCALGRARLLAKSYLDYEREIREHMQELFSPGGFDARRDIAGIILNRWGHAYVAPQPGFYFGGEGGQGLAHPIRQGHGRIFYGHSELGARMNYRNAIAEGGRAAEQAAKVV